MSNSILWFQPANLTEEDIVTYNGKKLTSGIERNAKFKQLQNIADKAISKKQPWCGHINNYVFVKGNLDGKDERGRLLSFMFATDEKDYVSALSRELSVIGYQMNDLTEQALHNPEKISKTTKIAIAIAIIAIIALITCILNKTDDNFNSDSNEPTIEIEK